MSIVKMALLSSCLFFFSFSNDVDPTGTWKMTIMDPDGNAIAVSLTFEDGTYKSDIGMDGSIDIEGTYTLNGDQITLTDKPDSSPMACKEEGVYKISITGNKLSFSTVSDNCMGRNSAIINTQLEKV